MVAHFHSQIHTPGHLHSWHLQRQAAHKWMLTPLAAPAFPGAFDRKVFYRPPTSNTIISLYQGRNEILNTDVEKILDKVRNKEMDWTVMSGVAEI